VNVLLWGLQALLACVFLAAGGLHLGASQAALAAKMAWVGDVPSWLPRFIGAMEVLGALGLIVPAATRFAPWLTPLAAGGLAAMMLLAAAMHLIRGEFSIGVPSFVLLLLCSSVAFGRANHVSSLTNVPGEHRSSPP
jgi:putative oxidoreductase